MADEDNSNTAENSAPTSNKEILRMLERLRLKFIISYMLDIIVPVVAVAALIIAVMAVTDNHASQSQLGKNNEIIDSLNSSLAASKVELEKIKAAMAQEKTLLEEADTKQAERMTKIIQNISQLQLKMKISPTLEEQLRQSLSDAAAAASSVAGATTVAATAPASAVADRKPGSQVQVLTEAIEKFNRKGHK